VEWRTFTKARLTQACYYEIEAIRVIENRMHQCTVRQPSLISPCVDRLLRTTECWAYEHSSLAGCPKEKQGHPGESQEDAR
jgi:hypothetical protein